MKKTVIFGGTFNPFHNGHAEILNILSDLCFVGDILLIPTFNPPHKVCDCLADNTHRLNMCKIASENFSNVTVSDIEIKRGGKSYTVDTLKTLKEQLKDRDLALVIGGDMLVSFKKWYKYSEILKMAQLIVFGRAGVSFDRFFDVKNSLENEGGQITFIDKKITDISSSRVRENIKDKEFLLKYLPIGVYEYIMDNGLYGGDK